MFSLDFFTKCNTSLNAALIERYLVELEEKYGVVLVSRLLAYVSASKHGLTEPEILDILALDTEVAPAIYTQPQSNWTLNYTIVCFR